MSKHRIRLRVQNAVAGGVDALHDAPPFETNRAAAEELFALCAALEADAGRAQAAATKAAEALARLASTATAVDDALGSLVLCPDSNAGSGGPAGSPAAGAGAGAGGGGGGASAASPGKFCCGEGALGVKEGGSSPETPQVSSHAGESATRSATGVLHSLASELASYAEDLAVCVVDPCAAAKLDQQSIRALHAAFTDRKLDVTHYETKVVGLTATRDELVNNPDPKIAVGSKAAAAKEKLAANEQKLAAARAALQVAEAEAMDATESAASGVPKGLAACVGAMLARQAQLGARVANAAGALVEQGAWQLQKIAAAVHAGPAQPAAQRILEVLDEQHEDEARRAMAQSKAMREALGSAAAGGGAQELVAAAEARADDAEKRAEDLRSRVEALTLQLADAHAVGAGKAVAGSVHSMRSGGGDGSATGSVIEWPGPQQPAPNPFEARDMAASSPGSEGSPPQAQPQPQPQASSPSCAEERPVSSLHAAREIEPAPRNDGDDANPFSEPQQDDANPFADDSNPFAAGVDEQEWRGPKSF